MLKMRKWRPGSLNLLSHIPPLLSDGSESQTQVVLERGHLMRGRNQQNEYEINLDSSFQ